VSIRVDRRKSRRRTRDLTIHLSILFRLRPAHLGFEGSSRRQRTELDLGAGVLGSMRRWLKTRPGASARKTPQCLADSVLDERDLGRDVAHLPCGGELKRQRADDFQVASEAIIRDPAGQYAIAAQYQRGLRVEFLRAEMGLALRDLRDQPRPFAVELLEDVLELSKNSRLALLSCVSAAGGPPDSLEHHGSD